jgi:hypothetical protein
MIKFYTPIKFDLLGVMPKGKMAANGSIYLRAYPQNFIKLLLVPLTNGTFVNSQ